MTLKNASLDGILQELNRKKLLKTAGDQGTTDTTHPTADAPNGTQDAQTGSRATESTSDVKDQQPVGVENTGEPAERQNPSGSQGVDDKAGDEGADLDKGNTSGKSEQGGQDTTHPSKNAQALEKAAAALDLLSKAIADSEKTASAEKTAEEKLAEYVEQLKTEHGEAVAHGQKFAEYALTKLAELQEAQEKQAAAQYDNLVVLRHMLKTAAGQDADLAKIEKLAEELAAEGVTPEQLEAELEAELAAGGEQPGDAAAPAAGGEGEIDEAALVQALEEAGITPEELEAILAQEELSGDEQGAALDEAMTETGVSPEEIAAAGGEVPEGVMGKAASVKIAREKTAAYQAFKNQLVRELQAMKGATK